MGPGGAEQKVTGPAIGLIVTAVFGMLFDIIGLGVNILGTGMATMLPADEGGGFGNLMSGTIGIVWECIGLAMSVVVLLGALKMKKLQSYGFAMAASIIAAVPCISPCCFLGLPIGIWAVVVLMDQGVKASFTNPAG